MCLLILAALAAGCDGGAAPTPAAPAKAGPLPPEVEHDPETATKQYQKGKTPKK